MRAATSIRLRSASLLLAVNALWMGCTATPFPAYPYEPIDTAGLALAAKPLDDPNDARTYFGTDMRGPALVPVHVTLTNNSKSTSYLVSRDQFRVDGEPPIPASQLIKEEKIGSLSTARGLRAASAVCVLVFLPGLFIFGGVAASEEAVAYEMQYNAREKEFRSATLSPGQTLGGFLYAHRREHPPVVTLRAKNLTTLETTEIAQ